jgi:PPOX class probable F420-dependent enzyme
MDARARFAAARVARLATADAAGRPHLVPVCFAVDGDTVYSVVDEVKPKATPRLRRLRNVAENPAVSLLVDHYDDDWSALWWVRADGRARVLEAAPDAIALLASRYEQYRAEPPRGPVLAVDVERWRGWSASQ